MLLRKFAQQLNIIFKTLSKPLEWHTFYRHDLPLLVDISEEVKNVSIRNVQIAYLNTGWPPAHSNP